MDDIELTIRLIMNHKQACQAIGRSGSNIKSLRDETGCKITMTNKDHPKRIMTISSKKSAAMKGKILIIFIIIIISLYKLLFKYL